MILKSSGKNESILGVFVGRNLTKNPWAIKISCLKGKNKGRNVSKISSVAESEKYLECYVI